MIKRIKKFFFENINSKQTIFKNIFWLTFAQLLTGLLRLLLIVYAARILGVTEYGKFAFAFSFVSLFAIFNDIGLSDLMVRELSKEKEKEKEYPAIISLKILLGLISILATFVCSFFIWSIDGLRYVIWVLMLFIFVENLFNIVYPLMRSRQKMEYEAATKISQTILTVMIGFLVIFSFPSAINLSFAYLISALIVLVLVATFLHFFLFFLKLIFDFKFFKKILSESWPLTFGFVGLWTYANIDSAMIGFFSNSNEVGWFNAASKIILAIVLVVASLISRSFFPMLSRLFEESKEQLQKNWNYYVELMALLSLPMMATGIIFSEKMIIFLYGPKEYAPAIFIFQCLIVLAGISLFYYPYSMILVVFGYQKKNFFVMLFGFLLNIILNLVLLKPFGFYIAAINSIIATVITLFMLFFISKKNTQIDILNPNILKVFLISFTSSLIMFFIVKYSPIYKLHIFISVPISLLIYVGCLTFFKINRHFSLLRT